MNVTFFFSLFAINFEMNHLQYAPYTNLHIAILIFEKINEPEKKK